MGIWIPALALAGATATPPSIAPREPGFSRLPLAFVENQGQWDTSARFVARKGGLVARVERDGITLRLIRRNENEEVEGVVVRLFFEGALETVAIEGEGRQPGIYNFFLGKDPGRWRTEVPGYGSVLYRGLQGGVDLRLREEGENLEYDLILAPGADLDRVVVRCEGIEGLGVETDGSLTMRTALGPIRQGVPISWHELAGGGRRPIEARFRRLGQDRFGFEVPERDPSLALVIDPGLLFSTFLGGTGSDSATAIAVDAAGAAVFAGWTHSPDFPATPGAYGTTFQGGGTPPVDAFVARLSSSGGSLVYSTFLGGTDNEWASAVAIDGSGVATVAGTTRSIDFPTTAGAFGTAFHGGISDGFVVRLSPSGASLPFATYLGGAHGDLVYALALDPSDAVTVAGSTGSTDYPTTAGAFATNLNAGGYPDAFVTQISLSGGMLRFSTYLGGTSSDGAGAIALDTTGAPIVTGTTLSPDFPTTPGAYDTSPNGFDDAFVTRISPSGGSLQYSSLLGGTNIDLAWQLAVDASGAATLTGETRSIDFPTTVGSFDTTFNSVLSFPDAFVARLSSSGATLEYSAFLGGAFSDYGLAVAVDASRAATVVGMTESPNFPTTAGAFETTHVGSGDVFVTRVSPSGGTLHSSTFLGGTGSDFALGLALDTAGIATVTGQTFSSNFLTTPGSYDTSHNGGGDAFVARLDLLPAGASAYGASTPGCSGPLAIGVTSIPQAGNAGFALTCGNGPPNATGLLAFSGAGLASPILLLGAQVWLDPGSPAFFLLGVPSNAIGASEVPVPIPNNPAVVGGQLYTQFLWLGPNAPSPPCPATGISASNALEIVVQ